MRDNADILVGMAIWLTFNAVVIAMTYHSYATEHRYFEAFGAIHLELQELRSRNASETEWRGFTEHSQQVMEPMIKDLEKTSSVSEPIRQRLLWAGRDHLRESLSNARQKSTPDQQQNERLFEEHMRWLEKALSGR